jgi:uncharacterized protein YndB with AHSA1/START domain
MVAPSVVPKLVLKRTYPVPPAKLFDFWTNPQHMQHWFGPTRDYTNPFIEVDLRVGGRYRVAFESAAGKRDVVGGEFLVVEPPRKLIYTWIWEEPNENAGLLTQVTVEFRDADGSTEFVLTHEQFPKQAMRDDHAMGWSGAMERLGAFATAS